MTTGPGRLSLAKVTKRYGRNLACDDVSLSLRAHEVLAVIGENGAGKSTAMKIAYGQVRADAGDIVFGNDEALPARSFSTCQAAARGVAMVSQHFSLVPRLTALENVMLGREYTRRGFLDLPRGYERFDDVCQRLGFVLSPERRVEDMALGERQRLEILKALWTDVQTLILDEPTAVLAPSEVDQLFGVLDKLRGQGMAIAIVTHKLDEVEAIADRVVVMRKGRVVENIVLPPAQGGARLDRVAITEAMMGRAISAWHYRIRETHKEPRLEVRELYVEGLDHNGVSFALARGEVLGVAGIEGNGQSQLVAGLAGLVSTTAGSVVLDGEPVTKLSPAGRLRAGMAWVSDDRHEQGLILDFTVEENAILGRTHEFCRYGVLRNNEIANHAKRMIELSTLRPEQPKLPAASLSGGNQQKLIVAREIDRAGLRVLLCAQPTRGVDLGAIEVIHGWLRQLASSGVAVLLVSSELSELRALADRVVVMRGGSIVHEAGRDVLGRDDYAQVLGAYMVGAT